MSLLELKFLCRRENWECKIFAANFCERVYFFFSFLLQFDANTGLMPFSSDMKISQHSAKWHFLPVINISYDIINDT